MKPVKRWCGRAAAGTETAAMNPMVEWHGDSDEDTPYVLASDYDTLRASLEEELNTLYMTLRATDDFDRAKGVQDAINLIRSA